VAPSRSGACIAVGEADATEIDMETLVNGECRQRFNARDMVFGFGEYLEYLSRDFTLYPGDVVEMCSPAIGTLRAPVVAKRR
jgi:2-keto-4-pentenoate hydratase/2-oxohepta-3-ene-1,7-dioic acid hydratase in catechol pathway